MPSSRASGRASSSGGQVCGGDVGVRGMVEFSCIVDQLLVCL